jgi:hypothetical protein
MTIGSLVFARNTADTIAAKPTWAPIARLSAPATRGINADSAARQVSDSASSSDRHTPGWRKRLGIHSEKTTSTAIRI